MFPIGKAIFLARKIQSFRSTAAIKQQRRLCWILVGAAFVVAGGCGYGVTMLTMEAAGNGGGGRAEVF